MPNNYDVLDTLYAIRDRMGDGKGKELPSRWDVEKLIEMTLKFKEFSREEIPIAFAQTQAETLARLFYGVQTAHYGVSYRFMSDDECRSLILALRRNLNDWIEHYEGQVQIISEAPRPSKLYTEADLQWVGVKSKLWETFPDFMRASHWRGGKDTTNRYLVIPGMFAVSWGGGRAYFTELITGNFYAMHDSNHGREITKDHLPFFLLELVNCMDWPTYLKQRADDTYYVSEELRTWTRDRFEWRFIAESYDRFIQLRKVEKA